MHGIDIVEIASTERLLSETGDQFRCRCFTAREQADADKGVDRAARFSSRFAVKEAVMKALGTGFGEGVGFLDIEVVTATAGAQEIVLSGNAKVRAEELGVSRWLVSTSHEGGIAIASVIGLSQ